MKKFITGFLAVAMSLGTVPVSAAEINDSSVYISNFDKEVNNTPGFLNVAGTVTEVSRENNQLFVQLLVETENGVCGFNIFDTTYFISGSESELAVGDKVIGYYDAYAPMLAIEPPQYSLSAIAVNYDGTQEIKVDRFDESGLSWDNELKLNISEETEIILYDGSDYNEDLTDEGLAVFYTITTRSIPPQTPPEKIVVLFDRLAQVAETPQEEAEYIGDGSGVLILPESGGTENVPSLKPNINEIIVEGTTIDISAVKPYYNSNGVPMIPLRAVIEVLNYDIDWDQATRSVLLDSGRIIFAVGVDSYKNESDNSIRLDASAENIEGRIFVPLRFFTDVVGFNNAYLLEGQVVIDNAEKLE